MFRRCSQNPTHVTALGVARANAVGPIGECDISIEAEVNDNFSLSRETMNVTRYMVLRISDEPDIAETKRCHALHYNPSDLGYQSAFCEWNVPSQNKFDPENKKPAYVLLNSIGWNSTLKF
jgi:hypothetical protein